MKKRLILYVMVSLLIIGGGTKMAELLKPTDTLAQGYPKINVAIGQAEQALITSDNAIDTANSSMAVSNQALANSQSTQEQLNQVIVEGDSSVEAAQARVNADNTVTYGTLKERLDTEHGDINSQLADIATNVKSFGAKGDGVTDDTLSILNAYESVEEGGVLYFPNGKYKMTQPLKVAKRITLQGTSTFASAGTIIEFNGCSGILVARDDVEIKSISIKGINKPNSSTIDIDNDVFGTIGLRMEFNETERNSATKTHNVTITGFNVGQAVYAIASYQGQNLWSGSYRMFYNSNIGKNDIGVLMLDGSTFNIFYGGKIYSNALHGIYSKTDVFYNETEFIGTAIELNGAHPTFNDDGYSNFGVYVGNESKLKFTSSYFELNSVFADTGGEIILNGCHVHTNVRMFARGTIVDNNSVGAYANKNEFGVDLASRVTPTNTTVANVSPIVPHIKITSNFNGENKIEFETIQLRNLPVKYLKSMKLSFNLKINGGINANNFGIRPIFRTSALTSIDGMNINTVLPLDVFQPEKVLGEQQKYEVYCQPRKGDTYLNEADILTNLRVILYFTNKRDTFNADYSIDNLDIEIMNPVITIYSDVDLGQNSDTTYLNSLITSIKSQGTIGTLTLENGWEGTLQYSKNGIGQVWLRGNITKVGTVAANTIIGTLPSEFKPASYQHPFMFFRAPYDSFSGGFVVGSDGTIRIGNPASTSLVIGDTNVRIDTLYQSIQ